MPEPKPRVTIAIPVYNGEKYLREAIDSVLNQSYPHFEVVISDNASTDGTQAICEGYAGRDARVRYVRAEKNLGAAWNFNRAFELARGDYFKWLAHDDLIAPDYLSCLVPVLENDPSVVVAYSQTNVVDENRQVLTEYRETIRADASTPGVRFRDLVTAWSMCYQVFGLIRASTLRKTPAMGNYGHGDGVLLARLGLLGRLVEVPQRLFFSRKHPNQSMRQFGLSEAGGNDYHRYTVWFDPSKAGKLIFPNLRILAEYWKSVWMYPLPVQERLSCLLTLVIWMRKRARLLLGDLAYAVRYLYTKARR